MNETRNATFKWINNFNFVDINGRFINDVTLRNEEVLYFMSMYNGVEKFTHIWQRIFLIHHIHIFTFVSKTHGEDEVEFTVF